MDWIKKITLISALAGLVCVVVSCRISMGLAPISSIDYSKVKGLSAEVQQKLNLNRPETVGQASRISGITPAAVALLMVHLKRGFKDAKTSAIE